MGAWAGRKVRGSRRVPRARAVYAAFTLPPADPRPGRPSLGSGSWSAAPEPACRHECSPGNSEIGGFRAAGEASGQRGSREGEGMAFAPQKGAREGA